MGNLEMTIFFLGSEGLTGLWIVDAAALGECFLDCC